ncbi:nucleoside deaminase [Fulvivirgaceae bacterium BMA12]|uniref:Nucleoside deaminase n=1 Tax=Agaribacillus aureus TaxID=3051825 RepID=A0ABT8L2W7_9BACT|nr:nucleoside deaminase [Fulvivirgaceae bacterium BMA12]
MNHEKFMRHCLILGKQAMENGESPVGAIVVKNGQIVSEATELAKTNADVTCHAEIEAIRLAVKGLKTSRLDQCHLYTTHEPCIMCSYVIRHHQIQSVIYGQQVPHIGGNSSDFNILGTTKIPHWHHPPEILSGICEEECLQLSQIYLALKSKQHD